MNCKNFVSGSQKNTQKFFDEMRRPLAMGIHAIEHDFIDVPLEDSDFTKKGNSF